MQQDVYHSSYKSGLLELAPISSPAYKTPWVFAAKDMLMSVIFLTNKQKNRGNFSYWKGRNPETGKVTIVESYSGAFSDLYEGVSGSIYVLPGKTFKEGLTVWPEEVVSDVAVPIIQEIYIENILDHLNKLHKTGDIEMYLYDNKPEWLQNYIKGLFNHTDLYDGKFVEHYKKVNKQLFGETAG